MSNNYASELRTFYARNLTPYVVLPASGVDLTIGVADLYYKTLRRFSYEVNAYSNFYIRRAGVFCNFADGLVFKDRSLSIDVAMLPLAFSRTLVGVGSTAYGSKTVDLGVGMLNLVAGEYAQIGDEVHRIDTVVDDTEITLFDESVQTAGAINVYKLVQASSDYDSRMMNIRTLNCMHEVNEFFVPSTRLAPLKAITDMDVLALSVSLNGDAGFGAPHNITFSTDSIDPAYEGNPVIIDVVLDIEYTPEEV